MAEENNVVANAISKATSTLKSAFGTDYEITGTDAFRYLDVNTLIDVYKTELDQKDISKFLGDISKSVGQVRSSYLPTELIRVFANDLEQNQQIISDIVADKESYENAFMRMLGMPQSSEISIGTNEITIFSSTGIKLKVSGEDVKTIILDERQRPQRDRRIVVNDSIYNMEESEFDNPFFNDPIIDLPEDEISETELQEEFSDSTPPILSKIETDLHKFSYLLIPPVQDSRISGCINEPEKIVAPNFSSDKSRAINGSKLKSSLLESIIRIRLDKLSGRSDFSSIEVDNQEVQIFTDEYGILESLFIIRIRSALGAFAAKINDDIDDLRMVYSKHGKIPLPKDPISRTTSIPEQDNIGGVYADIAEQAGSPNLNTNQTIYEEQKVIEDAIMALLDDNSNESALDLQVNTQRKSSILDSYVMSGLIGIINLPRTRLIKKIEDEESGKDTITNGSADVIRQEMNLMLGVSKGVGAVDILVFVLALFTVPEEHLLGLLSNIEYERFLKEFFGSGNILSPNKIETIVAVNTLSDYIIAGYQILKEDIKSDSSQFLQFDPFNIRSTA